MADGSASASADELVCHEQVSLPRFLAEETSEMPEVEGSDLAILLNDLASATKILADTLAMAGIRGLTGNAGGENSSGDKQQQLDVIAVRKRVLVGRRVRAHACGAPCISTFIAPKGLLASITIQLGLQTRAW